MQHLKISFINMKLLKVLIIAIYLIAGTAAKNKQGNKSVVKTADEQPQNQNGDEKDPKNTGNDGGKDVASSTSTKEGGEVVTTTEEGETTPEETSTSADTSDKTITPKEIANLMDAYNNDVGHYMALIEAKQREIDGHQDTKDPVAHKLRLELMYLSGNKSDIENDIKFIQCHDALKKAKDETLPESIIEIDNMIKNETTTKDEKEKLNDHLKILNGYKKDSKMYMEKFMNVLTMMNKSNEIATKLKENVTVEEKDSLKNKRNEIEMNISRAKNGKFLKEHAITILLGLEKIKYTLQETKLRKDKTNDNKEELDKVEKHLDHIETKMECNHNKIAFGELKIKHKNVTASNTNLTAQVAKLTTDNNNLQKVIIEKSNCPETDVKKGNGTDTTAKPNGDGDSDGDNVNGDNGNGGSSGLTKRIDTVILITILNIFY